MHIGKISLHTNFLILDRKTNMIKMSPSTLKFTPRLADHPHEITSFTLGHLSMFNFKLLENILLNFIFFGVIFLKLNFLLDFQQCYYINWHLIAAHTVQKMKRFFVFDIYWTSLHSFLTCPPTIMDTWSIDSKVDVLKLSNECPFRMRYLYYSARCIKRT